MNIKRLLYGDVSKIFISVLLGLGLATLFRKVCKDRDCIIFRAPHLNKIQKFLDLEKQNLNARCSDP